MDNRKLKNIEYYKLRQKFITNCDSLFITNCDRFLLQIATAFLLQIATKLLQIATVITNCDKIITNCDSYYKLRQLLQIATEHKLDKVTLFLWP